MIPEDQPDPIFPAELVYVTFKDKYTGLSGKPVPMYRMPDDRIPGTYKTLGKRDYFREVLIRKVQAKRNVQKE